MSALKDIMSPKSVAIVGASDDKGRIGGKPLSYMLDQNYSGKIFPVNPKHQTIQGLKSYKSLTEIEDDLDFVLVAVPSIHVTNVLNEAVKKKAKTALIFSSGFAEMGGIGKEYQDEIENISKNSSLRIIGPNCLGLFNAESNFYPTFTSAIDRAAPIPGGIAIASQSGAYGSHIYMVSHQRGLGINYWITTGNEADISVSEAIQFLAEDEKVHTIMAYVESVKDGKMFTKALDTARQEKKPVILMKVGRSDVGAAAANSHTASLAGEDAIYSEVIRAHGAYRVRSTEEMLDVAYATKPRIYPSGKNLGIVTISGGGGVLMADAANDEGLNVKPMPKEAQQNLKKIVPFASPMNPVDVTAQFFNDLSLVPTFTDVMLSKGGYDGIIGFWTSVPGSSKFTQPLLDSLKTAMKAYSDKIFINCMVAPNEIYKKYENEGFLCIEDPTRAVVSMAALMHFGSEFNNSVDKAESLEIKKLNIPKRKLNEFEATNLLSEFGINMNKCHLIKNKSELELIFKNEKNKKFVMKVVSNEIEHKTEVGGVKLNIKTLDEALKSFDDITENILTKKPNIKIDGIMIAPMIEKGIEVILGAKIDPVFGPFIVFGLGGIYAEAIKDVAFVEAPANKKMVVEMIKRLKSSKIFEGDRGIKINYDRLVDTIVKLSNFIYAHKDHVKEIEMNPVIVNEKNVIGLDALIINY